MVSKKKILIVCNATFISGAEISLYELVESCNSRYEFIFILPKNSSFVASGNPFIYYLPLQWFYKTLNPFKVIQFVFSTISSSFKLLRIVKKHQVDFIYANTTKANIYAVIARFFTKKKIVWQVRDNIKHTILNEILIRNSEIIISISQYIDNQILSNKHKKCLVYTGLDVNKWKPEAILNNSLRKELGLKNDTILIAQIGQLTRWKNYIDFIRVAKTITEIKKNIHFLIVGDDLSKREVNYKQELMEKVNQSGMDKDITFLGHRKDIQIVLGQINILIHPAINEPFGRVLIEAMSMEKPVIAYNCGGPKEIIVNNETGYLLEPYNYKGIAEKTILLLENEELRLQFGKAGRKRVIEKFNIESSVKEMKEVFDHVLLDTSQSGKKNQNNVIS